MREIILDDATKLVLFLMICFVAYSCSTDEHDEDKGPILKEVRLFVQDGQIIKGINANCEIIGDSLIECFVNQDVENKFFVPKIISNTDSVIIDGVRWLGGV